MVRGNMKVNMKAFEDRKELKRHKIQDGSNVFRFLPPFGDQAEGYPYRRWCIAWLADPETGRNRPYASPWSFGEKECPANEYAKALMDKRDSLEKKLAAKDLSKEEIREKLKPISDILWKIKPKSTFFYNAVNKAGEVGVIELKKSSQDDLKKAMKEYIGDYSQDPTSLNSDNDDSGVWFKISKTGAGLNTEYKVEKNQTKVKDSATGKLSFQDDQEPLPEGVVQNYEAMATDLFTLYRQISYDDLKQILLHNLATFHSGFVKEFGQSGADLIKIPGFEFDCAEAEEAQPVVKVEPSVTKSAPKRPMPRLDDEEDLEQDEEEELPKAKMQARPAMRQPTKIEPDLFDEAEDLLS